jgi:hypothetical protein
MLERLCTANGLGEATGLYNLFAISGFRELVVEGFGHLFLTNASKIHETPRFQRLAITA